MPAIEKELVEHGVSLRADARALEYLETAALAEDTDWDTEYLDYILAVKVVDSLDEAIAHINRHNTKHSETIVTDSYAASQRFLNEVDAAAVYVNASTRLQTDRYLVLVQRLVSLLKSCMPVVQWG